MYKQYFGFHSTPFDIVPNPDFLYLSERHRTARDFLEYGFQSGASFIMLTGEIGTGKTTLVRDILWRVVPPDTQVALIFQTNVDAVQLLNMLLTEFGLPAHPGDKPAALAALNNFLVDCYSQNRKVLVVVDEAQNLAPDALEELRMLSNLQSDDLMLLQVLLVGQPELRQKLHAPGLAQFAQRIAVNYHLTALGEDETRSYIAHRLERAGGRPDLFTPEAMALAHKASRGVPRSINLICAGALLYAFADQTPQVGEEHVAQAIQDKAGLGGIGGLLPWAQAAPQTTATPSPASAAQPEALPAPALAQMAETNQRLGSMESNLRALLDVFSSYEDELTRRIADIHSEERKATQQLAERCARLERLVRHMAAPLKQQGQQQARPSGHDDAQPEAAPQDLG